MPTSNDDDIPFEERIWDFLQAVGDSKFIGRPLASLAVYACYAAMIIGAVALLAKIIGLREISEMLGQVAFVCAAVFFLPIIVGFGCWLLVGPYYLIFMRLNEAGLSHFAARFIALMAQIGIVISVTFIHKKIN